MIPNDAPYEAIFRHESKNTGKPYYETKTILAWDDDGNAMIVSKDGRLVAAAGYPNFIRVEEKQHGDGKIVAVIPGGGCFAEFEDKDGAYCMPVIAWKIDEFGWFTPITIDSDGVEDDPTENKNFKRILNPEDQRRDAE